MPEFFLELFSEEIPARMQRDAADALAMMCTNALQYILPCQQKYNDEHKKSVRQFYGPRRIAIELQLYDNDAPGTGAFAPERRDDGAEIRGPRVEAPEAALQGFLRKHSADSSELVTELGHYILRRKQNIRTARELVTTDLLPKLSKLGWPKSMRWGQSGDFTWVRPLRRIVCLLDGEVIPFKLGPVTASNETEGHRFLAPGAFTVSSAADWEEKLKQRFVIADQTKRRELVVDGISEKAGALGLKVLHDPGLIDEVNGLVEWPVALIGKIDEDFMGLPPEVRELSMKVNQRYFALRGEGGKPAPYFAFVANIEAKDDGKAIVAGNERVLRARLSDAQHFWDLDLKTPLDELLPQLDKIVFHAKIGTQGDRVKRIAGLAVEIARLLQAKENEIKQAEWAGLLSKADLVTGIVGEFPELQGTMGGYYAKIRPNGWDADLVGQAISSHYQPKGPKDVVPTDLVSVSVAVADKIDTLRKFFGADEKPSGSSDPYALRRAALGVIRIILENDLNLALRPILADDTGLFDFIIDRLRTKLRAEGKRFDVLDAVLASGNDDDLKRIMQKVDAISGFLRTDDGTNLLAAYRRASHLLHSSNDDPIEIGELPDEGLFLEAAERDFNYASRKIYEDVSSEGGLIQRGEYSKAMAVLADARPMVDRFLTEVRILTEDAKIRTNRKRLLFHFCENLELIADFSKIEG